MGDERIGQRGGVDAPLGGGEPEADVVLEVLQRVAEALEVALDDGRQEAEQDEAAEAVGQRLREGGEVGERRPPPGRGGREGQEAGRRGRASSSGNSSRASRGGIPSSPRRPPSTIRPPWANPCRPIPERRPRPAAGARRAPGRSAGPPAPASDPGDGQAELRARPQPGVLGGACTIASQAGGAGGPRRQPTGDLAAMSRTRDRPAGPRPARRRRRSAVRSSPGRSIIRPTPPNCRAECGPAGEEAEMEAAAGLDAKRRASWKDIRVEPRPGRPGGRGRVKQVKAACSAGAAGLLDQDGQLAVFGEDLVAGQEVRPGRQDRGLDDRVLGAVEAEEVAQAALGDRLGLDRRPVVAVVERRSRGTRDSGTRRRGSVPRRPRPGGSATSHGGRSPARASSRTSSVTWSTPSPAALRLR